jgi:hypothetical protein
VSVRTLKTNYPTHLLGNSVNHDQIKVRAFHDHNVVVVALNDAALSWVDREELKRIASKVYGPPPMPMRNRR